MPTVQVNKEKILLSGLYYIDCRIYWDKAYWHLSEILKYPIDKRSPYSRISSMGFHLGMLQYSCLRSNNFSKKQIKEIQDKGERIYKQ